MELSSVRALKEQLRSHTATFNLGNHQGSGGFVSVGISMAGAKNYKLAVRFRSPIRVHLVEKLVLEKIHLSLKVPKGELDVQYTGPVTAMRLSAAAAPNGNGHLRIGSSISHHRTSAGTLGFFAEPEGGGLPLLVSANHVIGRLDRAAVNDRIVHPGGSPGNAAVATFVRISEPLRGNGEKFTDAASARLTTNDFDVSTLPNGGRVKQPPGDLEEVATVSKFSELFGEAKGRVVSFDYDAFEVLSYGNGLSFVQFEDQIEVESSSNARFSNPGDSGALVYDQQGRALGLLFAETEQGGTFRNGFGYVNPIKRVLARLGVVLLT
jgi:hypothetical protein